MLFSTGCGGHLVLHSRNHCRLIEESPPDWKLQRHGASHQINQVSEGALVMDVVSDTTARRLQRPCASNHVQSNDSSGKDLDANTSHSLQGLRKVVDPVDINMNI